MTAREVLLDLGFGVLPGPHMQIAMMAQELFMPVCRYPLLLSWGSFHPDPDVYAMTWAVAAETMLVVGDSVKKQPISESAKADYVHAHLFEIRDLLVDVLKLDTSYAEFVPSPDKTFFSLEQRKVLDDFLRRFQKELVNPTPDTFALLPFKFNGHWGSGNSSPAFFHDRRTNSWALSEEVGDLQQEVAEKKSELKSLKSQLASDRRTFNRVEKRLGRALKHRGYKRWRQMASKAMEFGSTPTNELSHDRDAVFEQMIDAMMRLGRLPESDRSRVKADVRDCFVEAGRGIIRKGE